MAKLAEVLAGIIEKLGFYGVEFSMSDMTTEVATEIMDMIRTIDDAETRHQLMDAWMCLLLISEGYQETVQCYQRGQRVEQGAGAV